ncbi:hypothetical protein K435DRAFT_807686 [Dendrothele bispora CBS 962.96]|uniref:Uncharacterized protein n=1 Tax=Dendrothele bispora (strain CBS 962.96) TaxID=1314807 RepID=A0A4S8L3V6_DENBC|nr:hypothetical protein K435DRAFT_807686 [Dendrothele bispora CBS 962.96]
MSSSFIVSSNHSIPGEHRVFYLENEAASYSGDSETDSRLVTPPRRAKGETVRECYSCLDTNSIRKWIDQTNVPGYGKESVFNSPDVKRYREEPSFRSFGSSLDEMAPAAKIENGSKSGSDGENLSAEILLVIFALHLDLTTC